MRHCQSTAAFRRLLSSTLAGTLAILFASASVAQGDQPVDTAAWKAKWISDGTLSDPDGTVLHFRRDFTLATAPQKLRVRVSADNRYRLFVNGHEVSNGPARGDLMHWHYEEVDLAPYLKLGRNSLAALVWNFGENRPAAQVSLRTGFLLQSEDAADAVVDTDSDWKVVRDNAYSFSPVIGDDSGGYYVAGPNETLDAGKYPWGWNQASTDTASWPTATVIAPAHSRGLGWAGLAKDWQLVPRTIPPLEQQIVRFDSLRRSTGLAKVDARYLQGSRDLVIPPNSTVSILLDQKNLTLGYPILRTSGGAGASATMTYAEALFDAAGKKGNRNDIQGKTIRGVRDRIQFDGGDQRTFQPLWIRAYRYLQLDITTDADPLRIHDLHHLFTAYPFEQHASFDSDAPWIADIWTLDWRALRLSAFETFWDTPYYEQLQYIGDSRIESLLSVYQSGDARLMRNAIEHFDHSRIPDGITRSAYPSADPQFIPSFSLWWVAMIHDYWMLRDDPAFIRAMLPGTRGVLSWFERQVDDTGMVAHMPWWNFLDWADGFAGGNPPGWQTHATAFTLQFALVLKQAAELEDAEGATTQARHYRDLATRLIKAAQDHAWDPAKGLFLDSPDSKSFSQQTNSLALLADAVPEGQVQGVMDKTLSDPSLIQATFYFRFYVDEALRKTGQADRYLDRLGPWRTMLSNGLTATAETPEPTRSDSHAWSAHPNYQLLATVLGVRPGAPGFRSVAIVPALGSLRRASGEVPHPAGAIKVAFRRLGKAGITGEIVLPAGVPGTFAWKESQLALQPGTTHLRCAPSCKAVP
ncbi:alpha-L-rhamnosidase N-terminal domain-containing protein [Sphingobium sufflavum]|uniref:alpha-L-rhamnosidase-related protein n=1 Tax=Sphingobium sufflavum TaxID=1129547 RepID=UPI001F41F67B|nr:alpha-L-rhamnosidase C-terminal domain-containing protein [Sphingobium sufflavum]MCE7798877.1 alpha-L-rhamnosidase N-terminal domain-containing protein [Sphingobium sufflavum]